MYAIVKSGGKQYRVAVDQTVVVEKLNAEIGETVKFEEVLFLANDGSFKTGKALGGVTVTGEVIGHDRGKKIRIIKLKRRKHYMKHQGHRQYLTEVRITDISTGEAA